MIKRVPQMPLMLQENYTLKLSRTAEAGRDRRRDHGAAVPGNRPDAASALRRTVCRRAAVRSRVGKPPENRRRDDLKRRKPCCSLGSGHCFRDRVLGVCPELMRFSQNADGIQKTFEGSSLETIRHMVASGVGITVLPRMSVHEVKPHAGGIDSGLLSYVAFGEPVPDRPRQYRSRGAKVLRGCPPSTRSATPSTPATCRA